MESTGYIIEVITFNTDIDHDLWVKNNERLTDELLRVRLLKDSLTFVNHDHYIKPELYYNINNVDSSHGSFEIELPNVTEETNMKEFFKVRNKLLSRTRSLVNKYFKSEPK